MIEIKIYENDMQGIAIVEIFRGEWNPHSWESTLEELAKSEKDTVFRINHFDSEGFVSVVIRFWLRYRDKIFIETSIPWIRKLLESVHGEKITFTDDIGG